MADAEAGVEQAQEGVQPGGGRQRRAGVAVEQVLADRDRRPQAGDLATAAGERRGPAAPSEKISRKRRRASW